MCATSEIRTLEKSYYFRTFANAPTRLWRRGIQWYTCRGRGHYSGPLGRNVLPSVWAHCLQAPHRHLLLGHQQHSKVAPGWCVALKQKLDNAGTFVQLPLSRSAFNTHLLVRELNADPLLPLFQKVGKVASHPSNPHCFIIWRWTER